MYRLALMCSTQPPTVIIKVINASRYMYCSPLGIKINIANITINIINNLKYFLNFTFLKGFFANSTASIYDNITYNPIMLWKYCVLIINFSLT